MGVLCSWPPERMKGNNIIMNYLQQFGDKMKNVEVALC